MRKIVNGTVVEIGNDVVDLFEKALEGNVTKRMLANKVETAFDSDIEEVQKVVYEYYKTYSKMPYPLYAIEEDIKYAAIANLMGIGLKKSIGYIPFIEVEDGLLSVYCCSGYCVRLSSDTWKIEHYEYADDSDADAVDLDEYSVSNLYRFFIWFCNSVTNGKDAKGFYAYAMPNLLKACGGKSLVVKWEIAKLLQFGEVPNKVHIEDRSIYSIDSGETYKVDIFWDGEYSSSEKEKVLIIDLRDGGTMKEESDKRKVYKFDVYRNNKESGRTKLANSKKAFESVFDAVVNSSGAYDSDKVHFTGIISGKYIAVEIDSGLYVGTFGSELLAVGNGVKLISMNGSKVFIEKSVNKKMGARRNAEYVYDISSDTLKVCNIAYEGKNFI